MTYNLCSNTSLDEGLSSREARYSFDVVGEPRCETCNGQQPEDDAKWQRYSLFQIGRLVLEMEGDQDSHGNDRHVRG